MAAQVEAAPLYTDASAPVEGRVRDLIGRMTLRENAEQMAQIKRTVGPREPSPSSPPAASPASQRDAELARKIGKATALDVQATGIHWTFAPCIAVCRDPRWGRCCESYSEDAEIVRSMTTIVAGLQGQMPQEHPSGYPFVASVG